MLFKGIAYIDALYILSELRVGLFNAFLFIGAYIHVLFRQPCKRMGRRKHSIDLYLSAEILFHQIPLCRR